MGPPFAPVKLKPAVQQKFSAACETAAKSDAFKAFAAKTGTVINFMGGVALLTSTVGTGRTMVA